MTTRDQIAEQALALPPEDRIYLADVLEQSLSGGEFATPEIAAEWAAEIDRRIAAYDRGETHGVDAQTALERIRTRLAAHRSRKVVR
jgi:putative addiction module component (TIGR02574 family)